MTETATSATYREVLAQPVYRVVFTVRSLAIAASTLRIVALSVLIFAGTGSAVLAATAFGIGFIPQLIGGMVLGALPDLIPPRPLIVTGYVLECGGAAALGLIELPVWASLGIVAVLACLTPVFQGSSSRLIAEVLTGDAYVLGRSLFSLASAGAQLVGMAGAGVAVATVGPRHALLACAASHLVAAVISRLRLPGDPNWGWSLPRSAGAGEGPKTGNRTVVRRSWRGNRRMLADPEVRALLLAQWLPPAFVTAAEGLLVPYAAVHRYPAGAAGWALACVPVGMIVGDLVVARLLQPDTRERLVVPLIAVLGLPLTGFAFGVGPVPAAALLFVSGCGFAYGLGLQRRFIEVVPDEVRGQAFALMSTGLMTLQGIGPVVFGGLAELMPIGPSIAVAGLANIGIAVGLTARLTRQSFGPITHS
ncbi:MAG TPA: MFS transporter [Actinophytocola sp.]|jgi:predicted MFS family arabinose efflux permease|uniref:MFS transporter n=1 Tax=Actinophytocola sp. TaxID=1872138 RepID=UPI002E06CA68|nr:MFS transporter [Actinophytocola sp.]